MTKNMKMTDIGSGLKGINFESWGGIENALRETSTGAGGTSKPQLLRRIVPWLSKANDMTALAVSQLPFDITRPDGTVFDTSTDWQNKLGGIPSIEKLMYNLASSLCLGKAYIIPTYTERMIIDLHYCAPHTVVPLITTNGLQQFSRTSDWGASGTYKPLGMFDEVPEGFTGEMMYFWLHDSDVEIGPAKAYPSGAALLASELIMAMDATLQTISERGFVPPTILAIKGMVTQGEREKTEAWYNRFLRRWSDTVAKIINAETVDIKTVGAGMADLKGVYGELKKQAIEDVGTAHGIPAALFMSDMAFASEVNPMIKMWYSTSVFIKIYHTIESAFNEQLLSKYDLELHFKPETLDAFQANEAERSANYGAYINAGVKPSIAARMVGLEMPDGTDYEDLDPEEQPAQLAQAAPVIPPPAPVMPAEIETDAETETIDANQIKELALWQQVAQRNPEKGASFACKFLPLTISEPIRGRLKSAGSDLDIIKAFTLSAPRSDILALADAINRSFDIAPAEVRDDSIKVAAAASLETITAQSGEDTGA